MNTFSSTYSNGLKINSKKYHFPDDNNLYGVIKTSLSKLELINVFHNLGWSIRKSSWSDFEMMSEWSELQVTGDIEILINGIIAIDSLHDLEKILQNQDLKYSFELYNENDEIIKTLTNN